MESGEREAEIQEIQNRLTKVYNELQSKQTKIRKLWSEEDPDEKESFFIYNSGIIDGIDLAIRKLEPFIKSRW